MSWSELCVLTDMADQCDQNLLQRNVHTILKGALVAEDLICDADGPLPLLVIDQLKAKRQTYTRKSQHINTDVTRVREITKPHPFIVLM